jgi:death-on-curing protein
VIRYLELDDLTALAADLGVGPMRDLGLLSSAVARPATSIDGTDVYPTLEAKAAALLHSIVSNHALVDGNKRLGWLSTVVFLGLNDRRVDLTQDEAFDLVMAVASGEVRDVAEIAVRLTTRPT